VEREAANALRVKAVQLGDGGSADQPKTAGPASPGTGEEVAREVEIVNPQGLHARPAALFAKAAAEQPVEVMLSDLTTGQGPADAASMIELMALGVRLGHRVRLSATGPGAAAALDALADLIASGLGEGT
jgi:phosphotransferase system HPr (HPr) family protein